MYKTEEVHWSDLETGLHCMVLPSPMETNNGYVLIPRDHRMYLAPQELLHTLNVHGGITHTGGLKGQEDGWWIGFDTMHAGDYSPKLGRVAPGMSTGEVFREIPWVMDEVTQLARQLGPSDWAGMPRNWMVISCR